MCMRKGNGRSGVSKAVVMAGIFLSVFCLRGAGVHAAETDVSMEARNVEAAGNSEEVAGEQSDFAVVTSEASGPGQMLLGAVAVGGMQVEGTKLRVYTAVSVLPDAAGMDHVNIQFRNTANDRSVTKILRDRDLVDGVYAGWLELSVYEPEGVFELDRVMRAVVLDGLHVNGMYM